MDNKSESSRSVFTPNKSETMYHRMKFYDKLMENNKDLNLKLPAHVYNMFSFIFPKAYTQKS